MLTLRYRLLPYIYSSAWQITKNRSTIMRPLVMDFLSDTTALNHPYEYMFGKAFLVAPVTEPGVKKWKIYLPKTSAWYDFWTGDKYIGGQNVEREAPLYVIPLYIKAGSILPVGPESQYATEKKWDNLEIRVYEGASGEFTFYEDEDDNYNYEKGLYSIIRFKWNNTARTLIIGKRQGDFPGMMKERNFQIILVSSKKGTGGAVVKNVKYNGLENKVVFR
jgi:Alpha-glucosidases, family 31 of glycosyl hydrolases